MSVQAELKLWLIWVLAGCLVIQLKHEDGLFVSLSPSHTFSPWEAVLGQFLCLLDSADVSLWALCQSEYNFTEYKLLRRSLEGGPWQWSVPQLVLQSSLSKKQVLFVFKSPIRHSGAWPFWAVGGKVKVALLLCQEKGYSGLLPSDCVSVLGGQWGSLMEVVQKRHDQSSWMGWWWGNWMCHHQPSGSNQQRTIYAADGIWREDWNHVNSQGHGLEYYLLSLRKN